MNQNHDQPPADQGEQRDQRGRFLSGHNVGAATRFPAGVSGNPAGRPTFGASVREWANLMADWRKAELLGVIADDEQPSAKVAAARQVMAAREGDGHAFDRLADRTEGRATQRVVVQAEAMRFPETDDFTPRARELLDQLAAELIEADDPPMSEGATPSR